MQLQTIIHRIVSFFFPPFSRKFHNLLCCIWTVYSDCSFICNYQNWYCLSKTEAESEAMEFSRRSGLDVVAVCPTIVLGPILQSNVNASSLVLIKLLKGTCVHG